MKMNDREIKLAKIFKVSEGDVKKAKSNLVDCFDWYFLSAGTYGMQFENNYGHLVTVKESK